MGNLCFRSNGSLLDDQSIVYSSLDEDQSIITSQVTLDVDLLDFTELSIGSNESHSSQATNSTSLINFDVETLEQCQLDSNNANYRWPHSLNQSQFTSNQAPSNSENKVPSSKTANNSSPKPNQPPSSSKTKSTISAPSKTANNNSPKPNQPPSSSKTKSTISAPSKTENNCSPKTNQPHTSSVNKRPSSAPSKSGNKSLGGTHLVLPTAESSLNQISHSPKLQNESLKVHSIPPKPNKKIELGVSASSSNLRVQSFESKEGTSIFLDKKPPKRQDTVQEGSTSTPLDYMDFAFLFEKSVRWISRASSRVMFVMRGVPGSGKSTIVRALCNHYPLAEVCSADNFWFGKDGVYQFDRVRLNEAHAYCFETATKAVLNKSNPVIIDNTNINRYEYTKYLTLANENSYLVIIATPKTPWCRDPDQLLLRNIHNVPLKNIKDKLRNLHVAIPSYFAWIPNLDDSTRVTKLGWNMVSQFLKERDFVQRFMWGVNRKNLELTETWWGERSSQRDHLTCKFFQNRHSPEAEEYTTSPAVMAGIGGTFPLSVVGVMVTSRAVGLQVRLEKRSLASGLWSVEGEQGLATGSRAHISLGWSKGQSPVQIGIDQLDIARCNNGTEICAGKYPNGQLLFYGDARFLFVLKNHVPLSCLFTGFYV